MHDLRIFGSISVAASRLHDRNADDDDPGRDGVPKQVVLPHRGPGRVKHLVTYERNE